MEDILDIIKQRVDKEETIYEIEILEMTKEIYLNQHGLLSLEQILTIIKATYHVGRISAFNEQTIK